MFVQAGSPSLQHPSVGVVYASRQDSVPGTFHSLTSFNSVHQFSRQDSQPGSQPGTFPSLASLNGVQCQYAAPQMVVVGQVPSVSSSYGLSPGPSRSQNSKIYLPDYALYHASLSSSALPEFVGEEGGFVEQNKILSDNEGLDGVKPSTKPFSPEGTTHVHSDEEHEELNGSEDSGSPISTRFSNLLEGVQPLARAASDAAVDIAGHARSFLDRFNSIDVAAHARSLMDQYTSCREQNVSREHEQNVANRRRTRDIPSTEVKGEVMCPTHTGSLALLDDYTICGDLEDAKGAFGEIMIVQRKGTDLMRACKKVRVDSERQRALIDTEIKLLRSLVHPNIVELHAVYIEDANGSPFGSKVYLVFEYCRGGDLAMRIKYHNEELAKPMSESLVAYTLQQILSATAHCHRLGIMHRDLKPKNILFMEKQRWASVKIIDFGLADFVSNVQDTAKEVPRPESKDAKDDGHWLAKVSDMCDLRRRAVRHVMEKAGSTPYMAPEVFGGWYDHRYDNFSIGVIMYEMLSGMHPFCTPDATTTEAVKAKILSKSEPDFPERRFGTISRDAISVCKGLLQKDPRERLSAKDALDHPWFKDPHKRSAYGDKQELSFSLIRDLASFVEKNNKFKRAVYLLLTKELSEQQIQGLRSKFMALDSAGDGTVSHADLREAVQHAGFGISEEEVSNLVATLSDDNDKIQYRAFISALIHRRVSLDDNQLYECFRKFDTRGTGSINYQDVRRVLCSDGNDDPGITESEWVEMLSAGNPIQDPQITELTFEGFAELVMSPRGESYSDSHRSYLV